MEHPVNTFDIPADSNIRGEKMIHPIEGEGYACSTVEDYIRIVDGLRSAESWTPEDQIMYQSLIDNAPKEELGLTDDDLAELRTFTPGSSDIGKHYGVYAREKESEEDNDGNKANGSNNGGDVQNASASNNPTTLSGHYDQVERARREATSRKSLSFKLGNNYELLGDRNIIIDYGADRPNQTDTYIEQESGDFHVNYNELVNSANVAIELESLIGQFMDIIYPEVEFKPISKADIVSVKIDIPWEDLDTSKITQNLESLHTATKGISDDIGTLANQIANFINCIRYSNEEADELFTHYFKNLSLSQMQLVVDSGEYSVHVYAIDNIINRYLNHDLRKYDLTEYERILVNQALGYIDKWKYHHMDNWEKFRADAGTFILSVGYGLDKKGEQFVDGMIDFGTMGFVELAKLTKNKDFIDVAKDMLKSMRGAIATDNAGERYAEVLSYLGMNRESGYGKYHESGAGVGATVGDILIKLGANTFGGGALGEIAILSMSKQGKSAETVAANDKISDEDYLHISELYASINIGMSTVEEGLGGLKVKNNGIIDPAKLQNKVAGITAITLAKNRTKAYVEWYTANRSGEYVGDFNSYCGEKDHDSTLLKDAVETIVNTCLGESDYKWLKTYNNIKNQYNNGIKTIGYLSGEDVEDYEMQGIGNYSADFIMNLF